MYGPLLGVIPSVLPTQAFVQPGLWSRGLAGAAVGVVVATVVAATLARRRRRLVAGLLALIAVVVAAIAFAVHQPNPGWAAGLGAMAAVVGCGALALAAAGLYDLVRQAHGWGHRGRVEELGQRVGYIATCECGWQGRIRTNAAAAFADAGTHANTVDLVVRRPPDSR